MLTVLVLPESSLRTGDHAGRTPSVCEDPASSKYASVSSEGRTREGEEAKSIPRLWVDGVYDTWAARLVGSLGPGSPSSTGSGAMSRTEWLS